MKGFRNLPAIITLFAGFCVSVIMIIQKFDLIHFLWILVVTMLLFYLAGVGLRMLLVRLADKKEEQDKDKQQDETAESEDENSEETIDADTNNTAK